MHEHFRQVVARARLLADARERELLERLRSARAADRVSPKRLVADRRQQKHARLLAAVGLPRRPDAPVWPVPAPLDRTPPALTTCLRCGCEVLLDAACACATAGDRDAGG